MANYTGLNDKNGDEIFEGDTVSGRVIVGILWKDVEGKVVLGQGYYALVGTGFNQDLSYVNNRLVVRE